MFWEKHPFQPIPATPVIRPILF